MGVDGGGNGWKGPEAYFWSSLGPLASRAVKPRAGRPAIVTTGCETEELVLLRNNVQHLGFQANGEGIVTQVERNSYAEKQGLKLWSRLIRICDTPVVFLSYEERNRQLRRAAQVKITVIPPDSKGKPRMSFSELYRKSIEETERKGDRATEVGLGSPCLTLLRMSSLQENRSGGVPYGDQCLSVQSCSLEKTAAQSHRTKEDPGFDSLRSAPPDVILAANPQHLLPSGKAEPGAGDAQVAAFQSSSAQTGSAEIHSSCSGASDPGFPAPPSGTAPSCPPAGANPTPSSVQSNGILIPADSDTEWQSLADIASYCDNLVQSLSIEDEGTVEEANSEGNVDLTAVNRLSKSPTGLTEKVVHLETIVKQLHEKLMKEKEDKVQLETEMQQLRQNNQRLHQESQTTVCHLLKRKAGRQINQWSH
ncbi:signal-induced proliferation-associated protein 1-like [Mustelus asterias]